MMSEPIRDGEGTLDVSFYADATYEESEDWVDEMSYEPLDSYARSTILATIQRLDEETKLNGEYPLGLGYSAFLARECVRDYRQRTGSPQLGACAGFHDGDFIHLGWV